MRDGMAPSRTDACPPSTTKATRREAEAKSPRGPGRTGGGHAKQGPRPRPPPPTKAPRREAEAKSPRGSRRTGEAHANQEQPHTTLPRVRGDRPSDRGG